YRDSSVFILKGNVFRYRYMIRKTLLFFFFSGCLASPAFSQSLKFSGNSLKVLEETPEKSTGLEKIYVLYSTEGVTASYTSSAGNRINWLQYGNLGGGHAEEVVSTQDGNTSTLASLEGDKGYIVEDGDRRYCFWITNYLPHRLKLQSAVPSPDQECGVTIIEVTGTGDPIRYFTINGQQRTLNQEITVDYTTQEWDEGQNPPNFQDVEASAKFESLQPQYRLSPPNYCRSVFRISGDRFLKAWNWEESIETVAVDPTSVDARTFATQLTESSDGDEEDADSPGSNQIGSGQEEGLGGSAPCEIKFEAYVTDGVIHHEWQLTRDATFEEIDYRFTQQDLDYTFLEEGSHYLRYIGSNADGSCEYVSDTYEVTIGESDLKVPNAFSPNGDGVNDEWKVAYRSLMNFQCSIFDRQGHQVCYLTSPEQGWDGKVRGKTVESGVFFYVIEATGTDGKKYRKSGDINIVKFVGNKGTSTQPEQ
ncbi:MAG: gliding motility-associated C-terminal domain-containing protein, partial [Muribaculaceae bacterium]|nr:gliding motility-associated C-terminal domain-containing protein [Muribaculaceae bacterium]